ncbi:MAG: SIMPL domain-containing protein [Verrucomicrobiota bacterium]
MTTHVKSWITGVAAMMLTLGIFAEDAGTIAVSGTAEKTFKADVGYIVLYVQGDGILMVDAVKKADENTEAVIAAIKEGREEIKDIQINLLEIGEKGSHFYGNQDREPPRPQLSRQLIVTIPPRPELAVEIIDSAIRTGATLSRQSHTSYSGDLKSAVVYGLLDSEQHEIALKKEALEDAKQKAEALAELAGVKLANVKSIGCQSISGIHHQIRSFSQMIEFPTEYVDTDPDAIKIGASISMTFEIAGD